MEHAGDGAANAVVETFRRVGMNEAAGDLVGIEPLRC